MWWTERISWRSHISQTRSGAPKSSISTHDQPRWGTPGWDHLPKRPDGPSTVKPSPLGGRHAAFNLGKYRTEPLDVFRQEAVRAREAIVMPVAIRFDGQAPRTFRYAMAIIVPAIVRV